MNDKLFIVWLLGLFNGAVITLIVTLIARLLGRVRDEHKYGGFDDERLSSGR
jgi:hypothetical protein